METVYSNIKAFILSTLSDYLTDLQDDETPLNAPTENEIIFGVADLTRYENKLLCVITPDYQEETDGTIGSVNMRTSCTVSFLCRGYKYEVLMRQMCRYAIAFRRAVQNDYTLAGGFQNSAIEKIDFFADAGTTEKQMTACEIALTVEQVENINNDSEEW